MQIRDLWQQTLKNNKNTGSDFIILLPPPNITGSLHIGHFFNWSIQDLLIRHNYMQNKKVNWIPGLDHSAISTQIVVERQLKAQGIERKELGYTKFRQKVFEWKKVAEDLITQQATEFGFLFDWNKRVFTMDDHYQEKVKIAFIKLYNDGLIKKNKRITNWDPITQTALSDLELMEKTEKSKIYIIKYFSKSGKTINIATTRPETIFADTAIAVHPEDERYIHLHNEKFIVPLLKREIPIIQDEYCLQEKGTGALKVTPAHDANDYAIGQRHRIDTIEIINKEGKLFNVPKEFENLTTKEARLLIIEKLKENGQFVEEQDWEGLTYCAEKSENPVETILTQQWFLDVEKMAQIAMERSDEIEFLPKNIKEVFNHWMKNIKPWCISRQIWWGHQIPIWYKKDGTPICCENEEEAKKIANEDVIQETDVLDTWFSSALWPMATQKEFKTTDILVTGSDILFFWVARMMMFTLYFEKKIPFKKVYFNGIIRDSERKKMSKTRGNVLNPLDVQEKYGNDALRYAVLKQASWGKDIALNENDLKEGRSFGTKFKNATKFINEFMSKNYNPCTELDDWMETKILEYKEKISNSIDKCAFHEACTQLYDVFWNHFCAWYIEGLKTNPSAKAKEFLCEILKIAHPIIPWISEECYQNINSEISILDFKSQKLNLKNIKNFEITKEITNLLRKLKATAQLKEFNIETSIEKTNLIKNYTKLNLNKNIKFKVNISEINIFITKESAELGKDAIEKEHEENVKNIEFSQKRLKNKKNVPQTIIEEWQEKLDHLIAQNIILKNWITNLS